MKAVRRATFIRLYCRRVPHSHNPLHICTAHYVQNRWIVAMWKMLTPGPDVISKQKQTSGPVRQEAKLISLRCYLQVCKTTIFINVRPGFGLP